MQDKEKKDKQISLTLLDDDQGQKHYITEVIAEEAYFADSKRDGATDNAFGSMPMPTPDSDFEVSSGDDLPF